MQKETKVVFLDIDGVLNGYDARADLLWFILDKCKIGKPLCQIYDVFGVRTHKVFLLKLILLMTGAKVVISSSWRGAWLIPYEEAGERGRALQRKLKWFRCDVIGITPTCYDNDNRRETEIRKWLDDHKEEYDVKRFVVLDDEEFDLKGFKGKELVKTSMGVPKHGIFKRCGLTMKHVIQAVKILNRKDDKIW